jgi:hypothetical protein
MIVSCFLGISTARLAEAYQSCRGKWCVHKKSNAEGEQLLDVMRRHSLTAISTFFQPKKRKSNATYLPKDPAYQPSQIDYALISSRWATSVRSCKVQWGISQQRWGHFYDHGLISCMIKTRIKMQRKITIALDYGTLKTDAQIQRSFDTSVADNLSSAQINRNDAVESLATLLKSVTEADNNMLPKRTSLP